VTRESSATTAAPNFDNLLNLRDLGGHPTTDGAVTRSRSLLRSDDLSQLTPDGLRALKAFGVTTVIDLRWPEEAARHPSPVPAALPQVHFQRISLLLHSEEEWDLRSREVSKEGWKTYVLESLGPELARVLRAIAAAPPAPLLFHCVAGKDRTGLTAAILLALADVRAEAIAADYAVSAQNLRAGYLKRYHNTEPERILEILRCPEEGSHRMLAFLKQAGGVQAYLEGIGLSRAEVQALRARLRD
jgi:protein-tyrosine phosphatase